MQHILVPLAILVFWLFGLLAVWSMCVVTARADRRMEEQEATRPISDGGHVNRMG